MNILPVDPTELPDSQLVAGHTISVDAVLDSPRLAVLFDLLSIDECDALIDAARARMAPSMVIDEDNVGATAHQHRTSSGTHFSAGEFRVADEVQARIMDMVGLPIAHAEPLQVLRYGPGEEYLPHFDFFEVDETGDPQPEGGLPGVDRFGQRVATVICYLSAVESGGETVFPEAGVEVLPEAGCAVYFTYLDEHGVLDPMSLHGGAPVHAGEKWIATQWCRHRPYRES